MSLIGDVKLTNKEGMYLGEVSLSNVNLSPNQVVYTSNGIDFAGTNNFTFDGNAKLHVGESLGFINTYPSNIEGVSNDNSSTQNLILQNKSTGGVASTNMYLTNDSTVSETANFCVIGMNGHNYTGSNTVSDGKDQMYIANTNKDIAICANFLGSGAGIHLSANGGSSAISLNPNNALSLGTTFNASTDTYTYNCGSSGQVLTSAGTGSIPTWSTPSSGISIANQANTRIPFETATSNSLDSSSNLTFNSSTNTLAVPNVSLTNINGSAYAPISVSNQATTRVPFETATANALDSSANLTFNSSTNTLAVPNVSLTNINGSAYAPISVANQADNRIITATGTTDALNSEANLSFDGTTLTQGAIKYNVASESVRITDATLTGNQNVVIGHKNNAGNASVCLGYSSGKTGMSGSYNIIAGHSCGIALTTGNGLVLIGGNTGQNITTGKNSTIIGVSAGATQTTQDANTIVGYNSKCTDTLGVARANCGIFGDAVSNVLSGDNEIQIGKSTTTVYTYATATRSDLRDKADIQDSKLGLNFIEKLKPKQYRWNYREDYRVENPDGTITDLPNDESKKRSRLHCGFLAQDISKTTQELNLDFAGLKHGIVQGGTDVFHLDYNEFICPLVKAVQELSARVKELEAKLTA